MPRKVTSENPDGTKMYAVEQDFLLPPNGPRLNAFFNPSMFWLQFGNIRRAEIFTLFSLVNRLKYSTKLIYPEFERTGLFIFAPGSDNMLVFAQIDDGVTTTSKFVAEDLREDAPAASEELRLVFSGLMRHCADAQVDRFVDRFEDFNPPNRSEIYRALTALKTLGILLDVVECGAKNRAVFNPQFVAATKSGIARGIVAAADSGQTSLLTFSSDIREARPLRQAISTGKRKRLTRNDWRRRALEYKGEVKRLKGEKALLIERLEEGDAPINTPVAEMEGKK